MSSVPLLSSPMTPGAERPTSALGVSGSGAYGNPETVGKRTSADGSRQRAASGTLHRFFAHAKGVFKRQGGDEEDASAISPLEHFARAGTMNTLSDSLMEKINRARTYASTDSGQSGSGDPGLKTTAQTAGQPWDAAMSEAREGEVHSVLFDYDEEIARQQRQADPDKGAVAVPEPLRRGTANSAEDSDMADSTTSLLSRHSRS